LGGGRGFLAGDCRGRAIVPRGTIWEKGEIAEILAVFDGEGDGFGVKKHGGWSDFYGGILSRDGDGWGHFARFEVAFARGQRSVLGEPMRAEAGG